MAQAAHEKWLQRNALLTEIEQAVRNERQLHAKENRMRESKRREKTILEREILPGQFLCSFQMIMLSSLKVETCTITKFRKIPGPEKKFRLS